MSEYDTHTNINVTFTWTCPECGSSCQFYGCCPTCGHWKIQQLKPLTLRQAWRCPGCGYFHAPHIDTCPICQPFYVAPQVWPYIPHIVPYVPYVPYPYIGDPIYVNNPPYWTITTNGNNSGNLT